jgi:hypothetical protein
MKKKAQRFDGFFVAIINPKDWSHRNFGRIRQVLDLIGSGPREALFRQLMSFAIVGAIAGVLDYVLMVI